MLHALGLGDEQRRQAGPHRRLDVGDGEPERPVDADRDIGAAPLMRLVDELGHVARHVEDRAPDGRDGSVHFFFPLEIAPALQSLSYSTSPSSGFSSASLCSPILGAALLSAPGVPERRGTTGWVGSSPISSSGISISASRSST